MSRAVKGCSRSAPVDLILAVPRPKTPMHPNKERRLEDPDEESTSHHSAVHRHLVLEQRDEAPANVALRCPGIRVRTSAKRA